MSSGFLIRAFASLLFLCIRNSGSAEIVYQNFGPGYSGELWGVRWRYDSVTLDSSSIGASTIFSVPTGMTYTLDSVTLPLFHEFGATNLEIALFSNNNGAPGLLLETIAANPTDISRLGGIYTFDSFLSSILEGGSSYWIVVQPHNLNVTDETQNGTYGWNTTFFQLGPVGVRNFDFTLNQWNSWTVRNEPLPALRIEGTLVPVPEPSTWALLALGSAAFLATRRRRK